MLLQSSTDDLFLIKRGFKVISFSSSPRASPLFTARKFLAWLSPCKVAACYDVLPTSLYSSRSQQTFSQPSPCAGRPAVLRLAHVDIWSPVLEHGAAAGCSPARRLWGAERKQRQLVTQHGVAGPRNVADAASAVIGYRASASKPGSHEGPAFTVTVRCQTAILLLKSATSLEQQSPSLWFTGQGTKRSRISRIMHLH